MNRTAKRLGVLMLFVVLFVMALAAGYQFAGTTGLLLAGCLVSSTAAVALATGLYCRPFAGRALPMPKYAPPAAQERSAVPAGVDEQTFRSRQPASVQQTLRALTHDSRDVLQQSQACLELLALKTRDQPELQELVADVQKALDRLLHLYENARRHCSSNC